MKNEEFEALNESWAKKCNTLNNYWYYRCQKLKKLINDSLITGLVLYFLGTAIGLVAGFALAGGFS